MKKNRHKEAGSLHNTVNKEPQKNASENILVFLVLAIILLSFNFFPGFRNFLQQKSQLLPDADQSETFVWLTGSSNLVEGLYQFNPRQLQDHFPEIFAVRSEKPTTVTTPLVSAIHLVNGTPVMTALPPRIASIFFQPIPINRANEDILKSLPGIGPALAGKIVQRRKLFGPFRSKEELLLIKGIGPKKFNKLAEHITLD